MENYPVRLFYGTLVQHNKAQQLTINFMKNLTSNSITLIRQDSSRAHLAACTTPPIVVTENETVLGYFGAVEIVRERIVKVDFQGIELNPEDEPFIVTREVFDALPPHRIEFVTPDYESAILNGFKIPHVIRRFIAKAEAKFTPKHLPVSTEATPL